MVAFFDILRGERSQVSQSYLCYLDGHQQVKFSYKEFWQYVEFVAFGLQKIGVVRGANVGLMSESSPYWLIMDLAFLSIGARTVPLFEDLAEENLRFQVDNASIEWLFIANEEKWQKLGDNKNLFKKFIVKGIAESADNIIDFNQLVEWGKDLAKSNSFDDLCQQLNADDLATIIYTSGSSGQPKGVELSLANLSHQLVGIGQIFLFEGEKALSCLPLAHIFERTVVYYYLSCGVEISFVDTYEVGKHIVKIRPTLMTAVPRLLEKVYLKIVDRVDSTKGLKKHLAKWAIKRAINKEVGEKKSLLDILFTKLVYNKFYQSLGGSLKMFVSGGAILNKNVERFFFHIGIPIYQGYGLTECSPVVSSNCPSAYKFSTVGKLLPQVKVRIAKDNEILVQSAGLMIGYHRAVEKTNEVIKNGWFYTGDLGRLDKEGYLTITGRKKELFKTSTGKYVSPVHLEEMLTQTGLISYALVIADNRHFVSCLLFVDQQNYQQTAYFRKRQIPFEQFYKSVAGMGRVERHIKDVNKNLNHWEKIVKYKLVFEPLSVEDGFLSAKMNIRRHIVEEKYVDVIEEFYK